MIDLEENHDKSLFIVYYSDKAGKKVNSKSGIKIECHSDRKK